jgi:membrane protein
LLNLKDRFLSFTMVLGTGFLLLVSLVLSAGWAALTHFFGGFLPRVAVLGQIAETLFSFMIVAVLLTLMYRYLPNLRAPWNDVWIGAMTTAFLFNMGKFHPFDLDLLAKVNAKRHGWSSKR